MTSPLARWLRDRSTAVRLALLVPLVALALGAVIAGAYAAFWLYGRLDVARLLQTGGALVLAGLALVLVHALRFAAYERRERRNRE